MKKFIRVFVFHRFIIISYILLFVVDINFHFKILNIKLLEKIPALDIGAENNLLLLMILTIFAIFNAMVVLIFQVYKNRYPAESLSNYFNDKVLRINSLIAIQLLIAIIISISNFNFSYLECEYSIITVYLLFVFFSFIFSYKNFNPYSLLEVETNKLIEDIHNFNITEQKTKKVMRDYREL